jgi:glycosyltransferase involved in cell wall biosynthesis
MNQRSTISVVTPSFRNSEWLKLCVASVADQGFPVEHIVQDAGSDDGTLEWLQKDSRVKAFVEKDSGMYDAINRGLRRASGDIHCYLNCDEQYLPGALDSVCSFFQANPDVEVLFGNFVVTDSDGGYLFHRKVQTPLRNHLWVSHLPTFSCAMFFRRHLVHEHGMWFNTSLRDVGDGDWILRLLGRRTRMAVLPRFTSIFAMSGQNMSAGPNARREAAALHATAPGWLRATRPVWILHHRLRQFASGAYSCASFNYEIFTRRSPDRRILFEVLKPTGRWKR